MGNEFTSNTEEFVCNMCGKTLDLFDRAEDFTIQKKLGYGTIYDGSEIKLSICCKCMERIVESCIVNPIHE